MITLPYVPRAEFERLLTGTGDEQAVTAAFADLCRINTLFMIMRAGSGHIGSSFSSLDIVAWLHLDQLGLRPGARPAAGPRPVYFSSKGHDAPGLYAVLTALGQLDFELLHALRRIDGLPGHPDVGTPGIPTNTGSLGMGISKAKGMVEAARLDGARLPVFVLTGDGELQEGQIWESLSGAVNRGMGEITVIVDHNKIQSDTWVADVSDLGDLEARFAGFGWRVGRCDGHDLAALAALVAELRSDPSRPSVVIADTVKGKGVSFMEGIDDPDGMYRFHSGAPTPEVFEKAVAELVARADERLSALGLDPLHLETVDVPPRQASSGQRLVAAYGAALCEQAAADPRIVALDADLVLDTGLIPFATRFGDRFIECGIAEQDMVSQAGGLALAGKLPVVHSFACFLAPRPAEQIYNNASEHTKVVYVGSLAGLVPGGPGHSHQSVRDIALFGGVPGLVAAEPCHEDEVGPLLDVCLRDLAESIYLRLVTVPVDVPFQWPGDRPQVGRGTVVREGEDAVLFGYGPVLLTNAFHAAERLASDHGVSVEVVALPWLNRVDPEWLGARVAGKRLVVTLDNHLVRGGQGEMLLATLARGGHAVACLPRGVETVPACGTNDEVLAHHRLDVDALVADVVAALGPLS